MTIKSILNGMKLFSKTNVTTLCYPHKQSVESFNLKQNSGESKMFFFAFERNMWIKMQRKRMEKESKGERERKRHRMEEKDK